MQFSTVIVSFLLINCVISCAHDPVLAERDITKTLISWDVEASDIDCHCCGGRSCHCDVVIDERLYVMHCHDDGRCDLIIGPKKQRR